MNKPRVFFQFPLLFVRWDWFFQKGLKLFRGYSAECFWLVCLYNKKISEKTIKHEKVHAFQQWVFTPVLYLLITGVCGLFYLIKFRKYKNQVNLAYYSLPFERWAYRISDGEQYCSRAITFFKREGLK